MGSQSVVGAHVAPEERIAGTAQDRLTGSAAASARAVQDGARVLPRILYLAVYELGRLGKYRTNVDARSMERLRCTNGLDRVDIRPKTLEAERHSGRPGIVFEARRGLRLVP